MKLSPGDQIKPILVLSDSSGSKLGLFAWAILINATPPTGAPVVSKSWIPWRPIVVAVNWDSDASLKEVLSEARNIKSSETSYLAEIFGFTELSLSRLSYLSAPLTSSRSETWLDASTKIAFAFLLASLSRPPPKNNKSAGTAILPSAANWAIDSGPRFIEKDSSLNWKPAATSIFPTVPDIT